MQGMSLCVPAIVCIRMCSSMLGSQLWPWLTEHPDCRFRMWYLAPELHFQHCSRCPICGRSVKCCCWWRSPFTDPCCCCHCVAGCMVHGFMAVWGASLTQGAMCFFLTELIDVRLWCLCRGWMPYACLFRACHVCAVWCNLSPISTCPSYTV